MRRALVVMALLIVGLAPATALFAQAPEAAGAVTMWYSQLRGHNWEGASRLLLGTGSPSRAADAMRALVSSTAVFEEPSALAGAGRRAPLDECQGNLKNIGLALEMYATDNLGHYPQHLAAIAPLYLKAIPTCAAAASNTYSESYEVSANPDAYTVYCRGRSHLAEGIAADNPRYLSTVGLQVAKGPKPAVARVAAEFWEVASASVVGQQIDGEHAIIDVIEVYTVHGFPTRVQVRYPLARVAGAWRIDAAALAPEPVPPLQPGLEGRVAIWVKSRGLGVTLAALYAHAEVKKP